MKNSTAWKILIAWFAAATALVVAGGLTWFAPPFPQVILFALVAVFLVAYAAVPKLRARIHALPPEAILAVHLCRFVGIYFLVLHARGELPWDFAVLGGIGDIVVAAFALVGLTWFKGRLRFRSVGFQLWNALGLIDILGVIAIAARNALADPESMAALLRMPLGLLPTFVVPCVVFTHVVGIVQGFRENGTS